MLFENREVGDRLEHRLKQRLIREPGTHQLSRRNDCSGQTEFHVSRTGSSRTLTQLRFGMSACGVRREKAALSSGCKPHPATAPAGSNRSSHGGNEVAEAFD
jgi:hypothetical protein